MLQVHTQDKNYYYPEDTSINRAHKGKKLFFIRAKDRKRNFIFSSRCWLAVVVTRNDLSRWTCATSHQQESGVSKAMENSQQWHMHTLTLTPIFTGLPWTKALARLCNFRCHMYMKEEIDYFLWCSFSHTIVRLALGKVVWHDNESKFLS